MAISSLAAQFAAERVRWPLWLPVLLGAGAGCYFALPFEPPLWAGWALTLIGLAMAGLAFRRPWPLALAAALLLGFCLAKLREGAIETVVLNHPAVAHLTGRIRQAEPRPTGIRLVLDEVRSGGLDPPPRQIRVALRGATGLRPGQWLSPVAEWEMTRERLKPRGMLYRYVHGIVITSLVGSLATLPFALFHFDRATHYAVLGNLIAMPVMGFWVMPAAALSVMLMPFGADGPALALLGRGIEVMMAMGRWVSRLPGAVTLAPAMPLAALVLISLGGLWIAIWQRRWRWWGLAPVLIGCIWTYVAPRPDMLVAPDARTVAIRGREGLLHFVRKPADRFVAREWLRRDGDGRDVAEAIGDPSIKCDGVGCVGARLWWRCRRSRRRWRKIAPPAKVVVSAAAAPNCKGPAVVIDRDAAAKGQGWQVTPSPIPYAESVRSYRGERPWVAKEQ